jgi:translation initiation factor IF-2
MSGIRVYKLAKELGIDSKRLLNSLRELKVDVKSHMSILDEETAEIVKHELKSILEEERKEEYEKRPVIEVSFPITIRELATKTGIKPNELQKKLISFKIFAHINQPLSEEIVLRLGDEFGIRFAKELSKEEKILKFHEQEAIVKLVKRAPIVTLMGHIDHGKTTLLEKIRKLELTQKEVGGITQHIGAYEVVHDGERIVFIDTPGHEAFTEMRARGAKITDIVILVVAADDGVMPQTIEAIDHAKAAEVPIIVCINKIDRPDANPDKVKKQLADLGLIPEEWGGSTIMVSTSALTGEGIEELLELILLQTEMLELKSNPSKLAKGVVIESQVTKAGPLCTVIVESGTLHLGEVVIAGTYYGKIKAMYDDVGIKVEEAGPSKPVGVLGLNGTPLAGENFYVIKDEKIVKEIIENRIEKLKKKERAPIQHLRLDDLRKKAEEGEKVVLRVILKADVHGSLDAIVNLFTKIEEKEKGKIEFKILHKGIGDISESDVMLAIASDALIIGFNVGIEGKVMTKAREEGIEVKIYNIIYDLIREVEAKLKGLKGPKFKEVFLGKLEVRKVFQVSKIGKIAGCFVVKGKVERNSLARIMRDGKQIYEGRISSLKRFKDDVKEVLEGSECGIAFQNFHNIEEKDIVEVYKTVEIVE